MHIEVLICTHNRSDLLRKTLFSLNQATRPEHCQISIMVAANACKDRTHAVLQRYQKDREKEDNDFLPLAWQAVPQTGKSHAINHVIPMLEGDLIVMIDDDHRIPQDFFSALSVAYDFYPEVDIYFGKIIPDWNGQEPDWAHDKGRFAIYPLPVPNYDKGDQSFEYYSKIPKPGGGNLAIRRSVFDLVGKFNTRLGPSGHDLGGGEDGDFVQRAIDRGLKLRYIPNMVQYHFVDVQRFRLPYILNKSFQRSRSVTLIDKMNMDGIPNYMWKKLFLYLSFAIFSLSLSKTRFYMVRIAASLGEMSACRELLKKSS